jgi:hypothetical protein
MNAELVFLIWTRESTWSPWVKPVLFAHMPEPVLQSTPPTPPEATMPTASGWPPPQADGTTAIVVDLPGAASVSMGLALAEAGYRPVPLYNAVPAPASGRVNFGASPQAVAVDMDPIVQMLAQGAAQLKVAKLAPGAPPAFLLDSRRRGAGVEPRPGDFDNRSISLPTDFPSANFMLAQGIRTVNVIQEFAGTPQQDLCHTLRRWQDGGIQILTGAPDSHPQMQTIERPPRFRHLWYGLMARMGLRRNPLGGYGGFLPIPSAG